MQSPKVRENVTYLDFERNPVCLEHSVGEASIGRAENKAKELAKLDEGPCSAG